MIYVKLRVGQQVALSESTIDMPYIKIWGTHF